MIDGVTFARKMTGSTDFSRRWCSLFLFQIRSNERKDALPFLVTGFRFAQFVSSPKTGQCPNPGKRTSSLKVLAQS
jgi:hypothetical protein